MARASNSDQKKKNDGANVGYEAELWQMADALRDSMDAAEYKYVVLGLIFLKPFGKDSDKLRERSLLTEPRPIVGRIFLRRSRESDSIRRNFYYSN
jgi:hypothetical protein